jgi:DNA-binding NarL/FixJ family response regulator
VRQVAAGGSAIDRTVVATLLQRRRTDDALERLTRRERQVLEHMASGTSNQGIADAMTITLRAAEKYVSSVFDYLGIASSRHESRRVLAVLHYLRA